MKNILAENMLRFGVKNLNHVDKAVINYLSEVNPAGAAVNPAAQAQMDTLISATSTPLTTYVTNTKITFLTKGQPYVIDTVKLSSNQQAQNAKYDLVLTLSATGWTDKMYIYLNAPDKVGDDLQVQINSSGMGVAIDRKNVYLAIIYGSGSTFKTIADKYVTGMNMAKQLEAEGKPNPLDQIATLCSMVSNQWKTTGTATKESYYGRKNRLSEVNPAGAGTFDQAAMDAQVAATSAIANKNISSSNKLDYKGGQGSVSVLTAKVYSRKNLNNGGIGLSIEFNVKASGVNFSIDFPIWSNDGKTTPSYYGLTGDAEKTAFDKAFNSQISNYFKTTGTNYESTKTAVWNSLKAIGAAYGGQGVATN